jgi:hypothetical protein
MGQPSIQVRANYITKVPGFDSSYHLFITVDDGNGNKTYYRGGPDNGGSTSGGSSGSSRNSSGGSSGSSANSSGGSSESSRNSSGGSSGSNRNSIEGGFQKIITEYGDYVPGSIDYNEKSLTIYNAEISPKGLSRIKDQLASQMNLIQKAKIGYFLTGPNSNSVAGTALRNIGINIKIPKGIWVPGFEQQLIDRNGLRASTVVEGVSTYANRSTLTNESYQRNFAGGTLTPDDFSNVNVLAQSRDLSAGKALDKENFSSVNGANLINIVDRDKMQRNIDAFGALSGVRNPLEARASVKQLVTPSTNNADLDKALAILNGMKQDNPESADKQSTTPEPVAVGSGKDSGMGL